MSEVEDSEQEIRDNTSGYIDLRVKDLKKDETEYSKGNNPKLNSSKTSLFQKIFYFLSALFFVIATITIFSLTQKLNDAQNKFAAQQKALVKEVTSLINEIKISRDSDSQGFDGLISTEFSSFKDSIDIKFSSFKDSIDTEFGSFKDSIGKESDRLKTQQDVQFNKLQTKLGNLPGSSQ